MSKCIGVLTAGGDSPGLNAAIRAIARSARGASDDMEVIGFQDGFRGLMENRTVRLDGERVSGILTSGGTILGTSRDKPHRMRVGEKTMDLTHLIVESYEANRLDALVCIGGGGTHKNAFRLVEKGLNVITIPKTIDNDVAGTDVSIGFDTALGIATEAIDRLHSTAHSHHRIIVVEIMGHRAGWLALGAGLAGGADVILIPEIPYDVNQIADAIIRRRRIGKNFSIVAVAEGAMPVPESAIYGEAEEARDRAVGRDERRLTRERVDELDKEHENNAFRLAHELEALTGLDARVTILGYQQRGGTPSAVDRLLATRLGVAGVRLIREGGFGNMVAARGDQTRSVPIAEVAGKRKTVPLDHPWIESARKAESSLGD